MVSAGCTSTRLFVWPWIIKCSWSGTTSTVVKASIYLVLVREPGGSRDVAKGEAPGGKAATAMPVPGYKAQPRAVYSRLHGAWVLQADCNPLAFAGAAPTNRRACAVQRAVSVGAF